MSASKYLPRLASFFSRGLILSCLQPSLSCMAWSNSWTRIITSIFWFWGYSQLVQGEFLLENDSNRKKARKNLSPKSSICTNNSICPRSDCRRSKWHQTNSPKLRGPFSSIGFVGDSLEYFDYPDLEIAYKWLENNTITSEYAVEILEKNANMWRNMKWGVDRDLVQFLCLTPDEFPVFVSLPTDPTLPIKYRRQKLSGLNYDKMVFPLGTVIWWLSW